MIDDIQQDAEQRMEKSVDALRGELRKLRTGRAHSSLLDHITVEYYGSEMPLNQAANIGVEDARTLTVKPWEKSMVPVVEKAIMNSDLGLNPATNGDLIRVPLPPLTEERRKEMGKLVRQEAEKARVAIRNIRRDANSDLKGLLKEKEISEDDERAGEEAIQKLTDKYTGLVDQVAEEKEQDLMSL
ncbi:ribosome recycling factor [Thiohalospira halophila DSM 15071]|uniref:Ribosome-recycling factor n=1 Tax=Thiohalospira halophila DSM 15071 TaxID=1123397 RepID=A0A1I1PJE9_9GAMM|nr:ribosome recycling factor [Thiohalospira halophila]SFD07093.1 ribosome recycling factor [Thiohalospira halophila DSM 15071]